MQIQTVLSEFSHHFLQQTSFLTSASPSPHVPALGEDSLFGSHIVPCPDGFPSLNMSVLWLSVCKDSDHILIILYL